MRLTDPDFERLRQLLSQRSGLHYTAHDRPMLDSRVSQQAMQHGFRSLVDYLNCLESRDSAEVFQQLIEALTIGYTDFFRNRVHFDVLQKVVLPTLRQMPHPDAKIKLWSAGCSTGEEAYSLAIAALETPELNGWDFYVLGTDVNRKSLAAAQAGIYLERQLSGLSQSQRDQYFDRIGAGRYQVTRQVRQHVSFRYLNLVAEPFPLASVRERDAIFCQNVIIYFNPDSVRRVIHDFYASLIAGGYLFLGFSESLWDVESDFQLVAVENAFIYQRPVVELVTVPEKALVSAEAAITPTKELMPVLTPSLKTVSVELTEAQYMADRGFLKEAAVLAQQVLEPDETNVKAHVLLGDVYYRLGDVRRAQMELERAASLEPDQPMIYFKLGNMAVDNGQTLQAQHHFQTVLNILQRAAPQALLEEISPELLRDVCIRRLSQLRLSQLR